MNHVLQIVGEVLLSALGVVGIIWLAIHQLKSSDDPAKLIFKWIFSGLVIWFGFIKLAVPAFQQGGFVAIGGLILTLIFSIVMAITWRESIIDIVANPIASLWDGGKEEVEPRPFIPSQTPNAKKVWRLKPS